ncbi:achaete-scute complex protein T4 [Ceratitis capitata]|uniref:Scute n=1 Tax=Ceratitis capitata TaxID=7213 RepID=Q9NHE3_CERCA|nr:achaete-scute complex protein T4 [Ceratitis capitata]AAF66944.1 scute [Ceratitis capitata]
MVKMSSAIFTKSNTALQYYSKSSSNNHNNNNNTTAHPQQQLSAAVKMFKYQNIAPAPTMPLSLGCAGAEIKTRKYTPRAPSNGGGPFSVDQTQSVQRRNARERNRVKQVNNSFARLRQHIPQTIITDLLKGGGRGPQKKISKVDTLRIAVEYIRRLQDLVDDLNGSSGAGAVQSKYSTARGSSGLLMAATSDNNTTSSNSSFSSNSSSASSNLSLLSPDSPTPNAPCADGLAAAEQLYFASTANSALQAAFQQQQQQEQQQHQQQFTAALLTAEALQAYASPQPQTQTTQTQLDIGCPSPTSSFNSSMSFDSGTFVHSPVPQQQLSALRHGTASEAQRGSSENNNASASQIDANLQLKFEPYDNFNLHEEDCTPDDEEILDYISLWQEQ